MKISIVINFTAVVIVVFACSGFLRRRKEKGKDTLAVASDGVPDPDQPGGGRGSNDGGGSVKKVGTHSDAEDIPENKQLKTILIAVRGLGWYVPQLIKEAMQEKEKDQHSSIQNLKDNGVSGRILPVFPATPVSNLHSMATGDFPWKHGIVADEFYDKDLMGGLSISVEPNTIATHEESRRQVRVTDTMEKQIFGGKPIWEILDGQVACMHWPGCEFGVDPRHFVKFDPENIDQWETRVAKVKEWLKDDSPIKLVLIDYRDLIDVLRKHGDLADAVKDDLRLFDTRIKDLAEGLGSHLLQHPDVKLGGVSTIFRKLNLNLIIVGSNGEAALEMGAQIPRLRNVILNENTKKMFDVWTMQPTMWLVNPHEAEMQGTIDYFRSFDKNSLQVYKREGHPSDNLVPPKWRYTVSNRIPSLIVTALAGHKLSNRKGKNDKDEKFHDGYDNFEEDMLSAFIASGPSFKIGGDVVEVHMGMVNVHLMLCKIFSVDPPSESQSKVHVHDFGTEKENPDDPEPEPKEYPSVEKYIEGFLNEVF